jgi:hypothetical protein
VVTGVLMDGLLLCAGGEEGGGKVGMSDMGGHRSTAMRTVRSGNGC